MTRPVPPAVYLVGGGPGDPDLITLRGAEVLSRADVVLFDRLINLALLERAPPQAERVYVGKAPGHHTLPQEEINRLLIHYGRMKRVVVRLHGGDPFVFGRGGEEIAALIAAGIPFEVVPGVTAAIAAPASVGIPLTQRGEAASVAIITGHRHTGAKDRLPPIPQADTLVFLMPVSNLATIVQRVQDAGYAPQTPAALIQNATLPDQKAVIGTLDTLVAQAADIRPPATLVIGSVVARARQRARTGWG